MNIEERTCVQVHVQDIDNVPVPKVEDPKAKDAKKKPEPNAADQGGFKLTDIQSREVRAVLFDLDAVAFVSNTYILPASSTPDGKKWTFDYSGTLELARKFTFKDSSYKSKRRNLHILFELVLTIKPKASKDGKENTQQYQVTNGWGAASLADMFHDTKGSVQKVWL